MILERANKEWIRKRWGGFTYLVLGRNEDFSLDFHDGNLFLHYENELPNSPVSKVLLIENPTQQAVIEVERLFGCSS